MSGAFYGFADTPFGRALLAGTDAGVRWLSLFSRDDDEDHEDEAEERALQELRDAHADVCDARDDDRAQKLCAATFAAPSAALEVALDVVGTPFQRQVWEVVREVPAGSTTTYGELCARLSLPVTSSRAVGGAVGKNPVAVVIPCHRVVRGDGDLGGFRWGLEKKRALLAWESVTTTSDRQLRLV